ncbi:MAG: hypothetical protein AAGE84_13135 [Cyanobacteria bacterium P01_G01_bin.39]
MDKHVERFTRKLAQDAIKRSGELVIEVFSEQNSWFKPALEELQNGTRRYPKAKNNKRQTEKVVRDRLALTIAGSRIEVSTESGRIDILTPSEIIEVKQVRRYKHAMGQITSYSYYYPQHMRRIHLFGKVSSKQRKLIIQECFTANITVTFEN